MLHDKPLPLRPRDDIVLSVEGLNVSFPTRHGAKVHAVTDFSFDVARGETLGLVGESGCGKSSAGRAIMQLPPPDSGRVMLNETDLTDLDSTSLRSERRRLQMIFQDPISSLNPRRRVRDIVGEGLAIRGVERTALAARVDEVMVAVGLDPTVVGDRYPHEFSGGQCQRICIARSLVLRPDLVICDEPVSALDVSVQAQVLNLLEDMKARYQLTLLFIAHDLAVVKNVSDRVAVMYLGSLCELGGTEDLFRLPAHPYTQALLAAIPEPEPDAPLSDSVLAGELPSPLNPPSGCYFRTRCPKAAAVCVDQKPALRAIGPDHFVACHFAEA